VGIYGQARSARQAFGREKRWSMMEENRRRMEQLYEALDDVSESYGIGWAEMIHILNTQNLSTPSAMKKIPWARLRMLVALYHPELTRDLDRVEAAGRNLGAALGRALMQSTRDLERNQMFVPPLTEAMNALGSAVESMKAAIVETSKGETAVALRDTALG
jgi:hypothetical protein